MARLYANCTYLRGIIYNQKEKFVVITLILLFFLFIGIRVNATEVASSVTPVVEERETWDKTKEGSTELMDKANSKVHEMTAPTPE
jgi:hypothetical protein